MEHPILFSGEMVRAILDGRKTQTRRIISIRNTIRTEDVYTNHNAEITNVSGHRGSFWTFGLSWDVVGIEQYDNTTIKCPFGQVGDYLWVRESLRRARRLEFLESKFFNSEGVPEEYQKWTAQYREYPTAVPYAKGAKEGWCGTALWQWKNKTIPSFHMPRWASRITLHIIDIRVERLQNISIDDIYKEGFYKFSGNPGDEGTYIHQFVNEWDSLYAKQGYSWNNNPWVWVIDFEKEKNGN